MSNAMRTMKEEADDFRQMLTKVGYCSQPSVSDCRSIEEARAGLKSLGFDAIAELPLNQTEPALKALAEYPHLWREWTFVTVRTTALVAFTETSDGVLFQLLR